MKRHDSLAGHLLFWRKPLAGRIVGFVCMRRRHVGMFDRFKSKNRDERRIERGITLIKSAKAIKEDRVGAIEYFRDLGDREVAVPALLQRFEYSIEHGINDTREKESCMEGILAYGVESLPLV